MMILRSAFGGSLRCWWLRYRYENIRALQIAALVALYLTASHFDNADRLAEEQRARQAAEYELWQERAFTHFEPVTFLFTARTPEELAARQDAVYNALGANIYRRKFPPRP